MPSVTFTPGPYPNTVSLVLDEPGIYVVDLDASSPKNIWVYDRCDRAFLDLKKMKMMHTMHIVSDRNIIKRLSHRIMSSHYYDGPVSKFNIYFSASQETMFCGTEGSVDVVSDLGTLIFNGRFSFNVFEMICTLWKSFMIDSRVKIGCLDFDASLVRGWNCVALTLNNCFIRNPLENLKARRLRFVQCSYDPSFRFINCKPTGIEFWGNVGGFGSTFTERISSINIHGDVDSVPFFDMKIPCENFIVKTTSKVFDLRSVSFVNVNYLSVTCDSAVHFLDTEPPFKVCITEKEEDGIVPISATRQLNSDQTMAAYLGKLDVRNYLTAKNGAVGKFLERRILSVEAIQSVHGTEFETSCLKYLETLKAEASAATFDHMGFISKFNLPDRVMELLTENFQCPEYVRAFRAACFRMSRESEETQDDWATLLCSLIMEGKGMCSVGNRNRIVSSMFSIVPEIVITRNIQMEISDIVTHASRELLSVGTHASQFYPIIRDKLIAEGHTGKTICVWLRPFLDDYLETGGVEYVPIPVINEIPEAVMTAVQELDEREGVDAVLKSRVHAMLEEYRTTDLPETLRPLGAKIIGLCAVQKE